MSIVHKKCLVCGNTHFTPQLKCTDYFVSGEEFDIYRCDGCGFVFTQDIPSSEEIPPYYKSEEYISHSDTQKGIVNRLYHRVRNIMLGRKFKLIRKHSNGTKLLDVGCGTGYFPNYMQQKGYQAAGMELDADARKFALENFGLQVESPQKLLNQSIEKEYDVITLWHVLEHLHEADKYLEWINAALKDDGLLVIALPNCNSFDAKYFSSYWAAYDVPRHLWHFTPATLEKYLSKFGLKLQNLKAMPFDAFYNALLSAKYKGSKPALAAGFFFGFISNLQSLFNTEKSSSVIYILKKA